jgi:hypothetical protein
VVSAGHATRLARDGIGFSIDHRELGGVTVATGHYPSSVAAMPEHTLW